MSKCRYCIEGDYPLEVVGFWIHRFSDRLISCAAHMTKSPEARDGVVTPPQDPPFNSVVEGALLPKS